MKLKNKIEIINQNMIDNKNDCIDLMWQFLNEEICLHELMRELDVKKQIIDEQENIIHLLEK